MAMLKCVAVRSLHKVCDRKLNITRPSRVAKTWQWRLNCPAAELRCRASGAFTAWALSP